jgi:hypothetical protein
LGDRPEDEKKATSATYEAEESKKENIWKSSLPYLPPAMKEKLGGKKRGEIPPSQLGSKGKISPPHAR